MCKLNKHDKVTPFLDQLSSYKSFVPPLLPTLVGVFPRFVADLSFREGEALVTGPRLGEGELGSLFVRNNASKCLFCFQRSSKSASISFVPSGRSSILLYQSLDFKFKRQTTNFSIDFCSESCALPEASFFSLYSCVISFILSDLML